MFSSRRRDGNLPFYRSLSDVNTQPEFAHHSSVSRQSSDRGLDSQRSSAPSRKLHVQTVEARYPDLERAHVLLEALFGRGNYDVQWRLGRFVLETPNGLSDNEIYWFSGDNAEEIITRGKRIVWRGPRNTVPQSESSGQYHERHNVRHSISGHEQEHLSDGSRRHG